MSNFFIGVVTFLALLFPLVVLHEFGHFFTARIMKVRVLEFGFGFPPKLYSFWTGKTKIIVNSNTSFSDDKHKLLRKNKMVEVIFERTSHGINAKKINEQSKSNVSSQKDSNELALTGKISHVNLDYLILKDMQWSLNLLPLGGFVRLFGEQENLDPDSFSSKNPFSRLLILFSGALINAIFPIILLLLLFSFPQDVPESDVIVKAVMPNSPAEKSGLSTGDKIVSVNGKKITGLNILHQVLTSNLGSETQWLIKKGIPDPFAKNNEQEYQYKEDLLLNIKPRWNPPSFKVTKESSGSTEISLKQARLYDPTIGVYDQLEVVGKKEAENQINLDNIKQFIPNVRIGDVIKVVYKVNKPKNEISLEDARVLNPLTGTHTKFTEGAVGIIISTTNKRLVKNDFNLISSFNKSLEYLWQTLIITRNAFRGYFSGSTHPQFQGPITVGPIGIGQITGSIATAEITFADKIITFINLASILSLSLAIINILPIPALDGGRILFVIIEILRNGRKISSQKEGLVHAVGFIFLLSLVLFISFYDVARIFEGRSLFD